MRTGKCYIILYNSYIIHTFSTKSPIGACLIFAALVPLLFSVVVKSEMKNETFPFFAFYHNSPAVLFNKFFAQQQAKPFAGFSVCTWTVVFGI